MDDLRELYQSVILDHNKRPRNFREIAGAPLSADGHNPLCGDKLKLYLAVDSDRIKDARFEGSGCAISVASASLLTDTVIGLPVSRAHDYFGAVTAALSGKPTASTTVDLGKLRALEGVRDFPSRVKCATLAWHAMNSALNNVNQPATSE